MKRIISIILAVVMIAAISMPIMAETDTDTETGKVEYFGSAKVEGSNGMAGSNTEVEYGVDEKFLVIIPQINFNLGAEKNGKIEVQTYVEVINPIIIPGKKLIITVEAESADDASDPWKLTVKSNPVTKPVVYEVKLDDPRDGETSGVLKNGSTVLVLGALDDRLTGKDGFVRFRQKLNSSTVGSHQSGSYDDNLTFTIVIE